MKYVYFVILLLAYIPVLGLVYVNNIKSQILGLPLVWFYSIIWVLFVFVLLVIVYLIDRKSGGIIV